MTTIHRKNNIFKGAGPRTRVGFLDEVRGLCILLMVLYHGAYDIIYIFGVEIPAFHWPILRFAQPFVAGIFILISGICCRFSRSNLKRGVVALALGLAMSAVTIFVMPRFGMSGQGIYFGILHLLGTGMILFALLRKGLDVLPPAAGFFLCGLLALVTWRTRQGVVGIPGLLELQLPPALAQIPWLIPLGFSGAGADHFPLLPWIFVFLAGSYLGIPFALRQMPQGFYRSRSRFLGFVGRHTIYVYVLHQPVVYGILYGFFAIVGHLA